MIVFLYIIELLNTNLINNNYLYIYIYLYKYNFISALIY